MAVLVTSLITILITTIAVAQTRPPNWEQLGLRGDYFERDDIFGSSLSVNDSPFLTRVDSTIDFDRIDDAAVPDQPKPRRAVRWTGQLRGGLRGTYSIHIMTDGGARMWIDRALVANDWNGRGNREITASAITLTTNDGQDVRLEVRDASAVRLRWIRPDGTREAIPASQLFPFGKPLAITSGGKYVGSWQSDDAKTAAVTIATNQPVRIDHSLLRGPGALVATRMPGVDLAISNCAGFGLNPNVAGTAKGSFIDAYKPTSLVIEHNYIEGVGGYGVNVNDFSDSSRPAAAVKGGVEHTVRIIGNQIRDIDGRHGDGQDGYLVRGDPSPHAIIFQHVHGITGLEIAWNEIINDPYRGYVNDVINVYDSSGTRASPMRIHDNFIRGLYAIDPAREYDSGCGIITDGGDDPRGPTAFVDIASNQVISTGNGGICVASGHDVVLHDNRILSSGRLRDGTAIFAQNIGSYIHPMGPARAAADFLGNGAHDNLIGWMRPPRTFQNKGAVPTRGDTWLPDADVALTHDNHPWPGNLSLDMEDQEFVDWRKKLAVEKMTAGLETGAAPAESAPVDLNRAFNRIGIVQDGKPFMGGLDGHGLGISSRALGPGRVWNATHFNFGTADRANIVMAEGQPIPLPSGHFAHLLLLCDAIDANQNSQRFIVHYSDGGTTVLAQDLVSLSSNEHVPGQWTAFTLATISRPDGKTEDRPVWIHGCDFPLDISKSLMSLTLPVNPSVVVFAITAIP